MKKDSLGGWTVPAESRKENRASEYLPQRHRAAEFGKGARNVAEIREATEARRANSAAWANKPTEPRPSVAKNAKP
jgi:hypothetical protein